MELQSLDGVQQNITNDFNEYESHTAQQLNNLKPQTPFSSVTYKMYSDGSFAVSQI